MTGALKKTAILFFSQTAAREAKSKKFFEQKKNRALSQALISKAQEHLNRSNLPVFHSHEGNQSGKNFGERLSRAFQSIFDKGYESVIAVGNDCPELENVQWSDVKSQLELNNAVIGQSARGGAYLIALKKSQFNPVAFESLPWCRSRLFKSLCAYTRAQCSGGLHLLAVLRDINTVSDIRKILAESNVCKAFKKIILAISHPLGLAHKQPSFPIAQFLISAVSFRGPPVVG